MGTRDTIKNFQSYLSWILIDDDASRTELSYVFLILFISNFYF